MEQFWTDYYEIDCLYFATCIAGSVDSEEIGQCVESQSRWAVEDCDESEFSGCASWFCIEAWREELDILEAEGRLGECSDWNTPDQCSRWALMEGFCGEVVDE